MKKLTLKELNELNKLNSLNKLLKVIELLRHPKNGCPWDIAQTFESLSNFPIEEAYELQNAINNKDIKNIKEELGDLLLQVVLFSQVSKDNNMFSFEEVCNEITKKIIRRHPQIFDVNYNENNTPVIVNADKERILQVLTNLVVNSIKYGKEGGYTKVKVEEYDKDRIIVRIKDNGEGIEDEHLPRLFERFYRIDKNRSRKKGGSGLGLSIVKHIIEAHQEQIFVESKIGQGTEFSFTLQKP